MAPAAAAFGEVAAQFAYRAPELPIYSTVRGRLLAFDEPMDAGYWVEQITAPVRFADAAGEALQSDPSHLLEIGPRRILAPIVAQDPARQRHPGTAAVPRPGGDRGRAGRGRRGALPRRPEPRLGRALRT